MLRLLVLVLMACSISSPAKAEKTNYLLCEFKSLTTERTQTQSVPLYYRRNVLVAIGKPNHCVGEPKFLINDVYATWRCVTAVNADQSPAKSVYVEIHRYTGRYHRNDFQGHYDEQRIKEIWHGVCAAHHEPQF